MLLNKALSCEALLKDWFKEHPRVLVALSGGVDSCLLSYLARKYCGKQNAVALIGVSPSLKQRELENAKHFCNNHDIVLQEIFPDELSDPNYAANPVNRCYFCKHALFTTMHSVRQYQYPDFELINGSNLNDLGDFRPGLAAAQELQALSPLILCGFDKESIRILAQHYQLEVWDKPASPCLSSRFPYGESITVEKLKMVEKAEDLLLDKGFSSVRVRYIQSAARIEVPLSELEKLNLLKTELQDSFKSIGFYHLEIDQEGLVSGKLNKEINRL
ncbi:MAG: ATP-dependent sacrificial sulfur transferase LarE [Bacteroidota bacterium]|nr:MAG: ATP-dependent sacrificial sulfur transferase LarE [Bacteroidota bacterium]